MSEENAFPQTIAEVNVPEYLDGFKTFKEDIDERVANLNEQYSNINDLANLKHLIYHARADLVKKKFELMTKSNQVNRIYKRSKKKVINDYKFGLKKAGVTSSAIILKNDKERDAYWHNDLRDEKWLLETIDVQLEYVTDQIKHVDHLIYGIENVLALEKFKTSM